MDKLGQKVDGVINPFIPAEGSCNLYYGQIRSGKTYGATADILDDLMRGCVVYATWPIKVEDFDDRKSFIYLLKSTILMRKEFFDIKCLKNFYFIDPDEGTVNGIREFTAYSDKAYIEYLNSLTHCKIYLDEIWRVIDAYKGTNLGIEVRNLILVTGHKFREVNLIAQRTQSLQITARAQCARFYKFTKKDYFFFKIFVRSEYQEILKDDVDETQEPLSIKRYFPKQKVFDAYDTHYFGVKIPSQELFYDVYLLNFKDKLQLYKLHFLQKMNVIIKFLVGLSRLRIGGKKNIESVGDNSLKTTIKSVINPNIEIGSSTEDVKSARERAQNEVTAEGKQDTLPF